MYVGATDRPPVIQHNWLSSYPGRVTWLILGSIHFYLKQAWKVKIKIERFYVFLHFSGKALRLPLSLDFQIDVDVFGCFVFLLL